MDQQDNDKPYYRRQGLSVTNAVFQTILTLTLSFLVLAEMRAPTLTKEALERARLLEKVNTLTSQLNEKKNRLDNILLLFNADGLVDPMTWLSNVSRRLRGIELGILDLIVFKTAIDNGWLSPKKDLNSVVEIKSKGGDDKAVNSFLKKRESFVANEIEKEIIRKTGSPEGRLFEETKVKIEQKAKEFQATALFEEYSSFIREASEEPILDWTDFEHKTPDKQIKKAKKVHAKAFNIYKQKILQLVPSPSLLPKTEEMEEILKKELDNGFLRVCKNIISIDRKMEKQVIEKGKMRYLQIEDLYESGFGELLLSKRLRKDANIPDDVGKVGPLTQKAIDKITPESFKAEHKELKNHVIAKVNNGEWKDLESKISQIQYDDRESERKKSKINEIARVLPLAVGLPGKPIVDSVIADSLQKAAKERAGLILKGQLNEIDSRILSRIHSHKPDFIEKDKDWLDMGTDDFVSTLDTKFWKELGINNPIEEHQKRLKAHGKNIWNKELHAVFESHVNQINKQIDQYKLNASSNTELKRVLEDIKISDRGVAQKRQKIDQIMNTLIPKNAPEIVRSKARDDDKINLKAEKLYNSRIKELELRLLSEAESVAEMLSSKLTAKQWNEVSKNEVSNRLYNELLKELFKGGYIK